MTSLFIQPSPDDGQGSRVASQVEDLYERHEALVRSICRGLLRNRVEAEDAVQQTFLSAQRALLNGSSPRDGAAWLAAIARHESLSLVRARMREPLSLEIGEHGTALDAHSEAVRNQKASELHEALAGLPRRQREAILLRELRGFSSDEVAAALSVTTFAAESLVSRARRSLQIRLQAGLAGLSPGLWFAPLRDIATRAASGGLAAPAAAKVAAIGAGTVLVAGGALVGPRVLGLGHVPRPTRSALGSFAHRTSHAAPSKAFSLGPVARTEHTVVTLDRDYRVPAVDSLRRAAAGGQRTSRDSTVGSADSNHVVSGATQDVSDDSSAQQAATSGGGDGSQDSSSSSSSGGSGDNSGQSGSTDSSPGTTSPGGSGPDD
jgi:RNA polymerase sigma-70 factor (ECF subfamily)